MSFEDQFDGAVERVSLGKTFLISQWMWMGCVLKPFFRLGE